MLKAYEIMTHALATCAPDARVSDVAMLMRDRNIGDVLVVEDGKLCGIVTDRDLAIQALTEPADPQPIQIRKYMHSPVVTGEPEWSLEHVAKVMAKHQIRRLPIVRQGQLIGIVSLGDVARHDTKKHVVAKSLQAISGPVRTSSLKHWGRGGAVATLALTAFATTVMAWLALSHSGQVLRKQMAKSKLYHTARDAVETLRRQTHSKLNELAAQLSTLTPKPKRKRFWFA